MIVLYLHQHFTTPRGSTGTRSYEFARRLKERGHEAVVICGSHQVGNTGLEGKFFRGVRRGVVDGLTVIEIEVPYSNLDGFVRRSWMFLVFAFRSARVVISEPCDLIFATSTPLTVGLPALIGKWFHRVPLVFEVRDLWPELPRAMGVITNPIILALMSLLEWLCYRNASIVIGLSPGIIDGIRKSGVADERMRMIPNGCDLALFGDVADDHRVDSIVDDQYFNAIFCGAHGMANGLEAIVNAARVLQNSQEQAIRLLFIGEGAEKKRLQAMVEAEGLRNCLFLDAIPKTDLVAVLGQCDVGIMCLKNIPAFYYGTSPNKFFDYIASGLPVLNNYPGWLADMIQEHDCGVVVPPDDAGAFAAALVSLANDKARLQQMGVNARQLAASFSRDSLAGEFVEVLEAVHEEDS